MVDDHINKITPYERLMQELKEVRSQLHAKEQECLELSRDITGRKQAELPIKRLARFPEENPHPVMRVNANGKLLYRNSASRPLLNYWGVQPGRIVPDDWVRIVRQALKEDTPKEVDLPCGSKIFRFCFAPVPENSYVNLYGQDITERKKMEEELREKNDHLRLATEAAEMYGWEVDLVSRSFKASENADHVVTFPMPGNLSEVWDLIHPDDLDLVKKSMVQSVEKRGEFKIEYRINSPFLPKETWLFSAGVTITGTDGTPMRVVGVTQNITKHKKTEEMLRRWNESLEQQVAERTELAEARAKQLQELAVKLVEAEERVRKQIAVLLHDDLQQLLAGARLQLQAACSVLPENLRMLPSLRNVDNLLETSIEKSRKLSHELSPPILHHSGLVPGIEWLSRNMEEQFGMRVELEADTNKRPGKSPLIIFLFRAVQELLFNVVKHAGVKDARVILSDSGKDISVTVEDEGSGFYTEILEYTTTTGFGLLNLREHARYLGGDLKVESELGLGSRLTLSVPVSTVEKNTTE